MARLMTTLVLSLLLLGGCARAPVPLPERTEMVLKVELFETEELLNEYISIHYPGEEPTLGFAMWYIDETECTVYLVRSIRDERTYGHELMHCIYGAYHEEAE